MLTMPILMLYYKDMGFTTEQAFRLKALYSVAIVLFEIPSGYLADVLGRKTTLVAGAILGTLGFVIYATTASFAWFVVAELTLGVGQSLVSGADSAMLYDSLKAQKRQNQYTRFEGINTSVGNFAEALGAILGGALAEFSLRVPFIGQSFIAFMAIPAALTLVEPERLQKRIKTGFGDVLKIVHYALVVNRDLRWGLVYSSLIGTATLTMAWVYQLALHDFGFSEFYIGATATGLNLLVGLVTLMAWKIERDLPPRMLIPLITIVITGGFVAGGLAGGWVPFILVLVVFYAARGIATPVLKNIVNVMAPSDIRATILSIRSLIIRAIFAIVAPFFGWTADLLTLGQALIITGLVFAVACSLVIMLFIRSLENPETKVQ
jgi:MFS family permease